MTSFFATDKKNFFLTGGSVMLSGSITVDGMAHFTIIEDKMTGKSYSEMLVKDIIPAGKAAIGGKDWILQDNDPKHTSKVAKATIKKSGVELMPWCAQSPDLNPIEQFWAVLKQRIAQQPLARNIQELKRIIARECRKMMNPVDKTLFINLIHSMPARCQQVIDAHGGNIDA
jgi:transposase